MLKTLTRDDTTTTPYLATKDWNLSNVANEDVVLAENGNPVAAENVDYFSTTTQFNYNCNVAIEDQALDLVRYREGLKTEGLFYPDLDPKNLDGTYKRLVYAQIRTMFYNHFRDPTKMWGTEKIDFDTSQTKKFLSDSIKLFDIPTSIMGQKILEGSVSIIDNTLDNSYLITDDGKCNLFAGTNLFSKQQVLGEFHNVFQSGSDSGCDLYFSFSPPVAPILFGNFGGLTNNFVTGSLTWTETGPPVLGFQLERSLDGINFLVDGVFNGSTFSFLDYPLSSSINYYYRINATNAIGTSSYSNIVNIFTLVLVDDNFQSYASGQTANFSGGTSVGWTGPWKVDPRALLVAADNWNTYAAGQTASFNDHDGWNRPWIVSQSLNNFIAFDDFNLYLVGINTGSSGYSSGSGWVRAWIVSGSLNNFISMDDWNTYISGQTSSFSSGSGWSQSLWTVK